MLRVAKAVGALRRPRPWPTMMAALIALAAALIPPVTAVPDPAREGRQPAITIGEDDR